MRPQAIKLIFLGSALVILLSCGVKGDPLPPADMPKLGRGHPTYQRASEKIKPNSPQLGEDKESTQEESK